MMEAFDFFATWKREGFWVAATGKTFKEWCLDKVISFGEFIYEVSDYALAVIMILLLFAMFGSKKATTGIYWTMATYIIVKAVGGTVL